MFDFFKKKKVDPKSRLREILRDVSLPSFPGVIMEILSRIRRPDTSASEVGNLISLDPRLTVQVLQAANSAAYSSRHRVENVNQAVAIMGLTHVESIVLSIAVGNVLPRETVTGYEFSRFWKTSCRRGVTARSLASILCPAKDAECFSAGFLQDLAIPFLAQAQEVVYGEILERWHRGEAFCLTALEREVFGWDHAEVATFILSEWELPESLASAIGGHHNGGAGDYDCPPPVLLVGHLRETEENPGVDRLIEDAEKKYRIPPENTKRLVEESFDRAEQFASLLM